MAASPENRPSCIRLVSRRSAGRSRSRSQIAESKATATALIQGSLVRIRANRRDRANNRGPDARYLTITLSARAAQDADEHLNSESSNSVVSESYAGGAAAVSSARIRVSMVRENKQASGSSVAEHSVQQDLPSGIRLDSLEIKMAIRTPDAEWHGDLVHGSGPNAVWERRI